MFPHGDDSRHLCPPGPVRCGGPDTSSCGPDICNQFLPQARIEDLFIIGVGQAAHRIVTGVEG